MYNKITTYLALLALPALAHATGESRDPFSPFAWDNTPDIKNTKTVSKDSIITTPLTEDPISSYRLTGLIVSPTDSIVLIKSRDKREYFANIGDALGNEGGIIDVISSDGITVDLNGKLIDIIVSNRFEIQNESN